MTEEENKEGVAESEVSAEKIKIPHKQSPQFTSHFATGAIVTAEGSDSYNHIIFYSEAVEIRRETGIQVGEDEYKTIFEDDDLFRHREDKARITMDTPTLNLLYSILKKRFDGKEPVDNE